MNLKSRGTVCKVLNEDCAKFVEEQSGEKDKKGDGNV